MRIAEMSAWDALVVLGLMALGALYTAGRVRLASHARHDRTRREPHGGLRWREPIAFWCGWLAMLLAVLPPLDLLSQQRFSAHMLQHELLMLVGAPLIIAARPLATFLWGLPVAWRQAAARMLQRRGMMNLWRGLTWPLAAWALHGLALWLWHVPVLYESAVRHEGVHFLQHAMFVGTAMLFWWGLVNGRYGRAGYGASVFYVFTTVVHTGLLGAVFTLASSPLYPLYAARTPDPVADQQLAGLVMWVPAGLVLTLTGIALFAAWLGEAERRARAASTGSRARLLALLMLLASGGMRAASGPTAFGPAALAFVSNEGEGTISIIDTATHRVRQTIPVGGRPRGIQAAPDGRTVFVAISDTDERRQGVGDAVVAIDVRTARVTGRFDAGSDPEQFAVSPDGRLLFSSNEDAGTASITDIARRRVVATLAVGIEPEGVAISRDGRWVYVTAETSNTVTVIDAKRRRVASSFVVDPRPRAAAFSPDGARAYVTAEIGGTIAVVDVSRHRVVRTVRLPPGSKPVGVVVSPDGQRVYVANGRGNQVTVCDRDAKVLATIAVDGRPWNLALSPDGRQLYTTDGLLNRVSVIDTVSRTVTRTIATGRRPWGITLVSGMSGAPRGGQPSTSDANPDPNRAR